MTASEVVAEMRRSFWSGFIVGFSLALILTACTGCATIREHPRTSAAVLMVVATSIAISAQHEEPGRVGLQPLNCQQKPESCR